MFRRSRCVLTTALIVTSCVFGPTGSATAGTASGTTATVTGGAVFTPWGDSRWYEPVPGGTADRPFRYLPLPGGRWLAEGWGSFRRAGFTTGGTPWDVWRSSTRSVVELRDRYAAATLSTSTDQIEDLRFFYRAPRAGARLDVRITTRDLDHHQFSERYYSLCAPSQGWNASPALPMGSAGRTGFFAVTIEFYSYDAGGFRIDDVSIDPWRPR